MDIKDQCAAIGLEVKGLKDGLPVFRDVELKRVGKSIKAFTKGPFKPWESPKEVKDFDSKVLDKVTKIADGKEAELVKADRDAIAAAENASLSDDELFMKLLKAEKAKAKPAYLKEWTDRLAG